MKMPNEWYCQINQNEIGPLTSSQLKKLAAVGTLAPTDKVRSSQSTNWKSASQMRGLFPTNPDPTNPAPNNPAHTLTKEPSDKKKAFRNPVLFDSVQSKYWFEKGFMNYAVFDGRAHRREYWTFFLNNSLFSFVLSFFDFALGAGGKLAGLYLLAVLCPSIAVGVRRMHDTDRSGWWLLFPVLNLYYLISRGTNGSNQFGPVPEGYTPIKS